mmetsp:Transcript_480/g.1172  ORF Transcript_480/g.1172 Transcript_480/m.1172 type:complete len:151 (-) Transcript_480:84-536(-)
MDFPRMKDEFPWDEDRKGARDLVKGAQESFLSMGLALDEEKRAREVAEKQRKQDTFWLEAQLDVANRKLKEAEKLLRDQAAERKADAEVMGLELEKVKAERDRYHRRAASMEEQAASQRARARGVQGAPRVVIVCLETAVVDADAEFRTR